MRLNFLPIIFCALAMSLVPAYADEVCVENDHDEELLFAVEANGGDRVLSRLTTGQRLCVEGKDNAGGVVSVFESLDAAEGCSRLVAAPGGMRVLHRYVSFDRCAWDDNAG